MRMAGERRGACAAVAGIIALIVLGCGDSASSRSGGERVTQREQRALPTDQLSLGAELCPEEWDATRLPSADSRRRQTTGRRQLAALEAAYRRHPDALVHTTYASSDEGPGS